MLGPRRTGAERPGVEPLRESARGRRRPASPALGARSSAPPPRRARACPRRRSPPFTTQPTTGTTPTVRRASARKPSPEPITASTSGSRSRVDLEAVRVGDPQHEPHLVQRQHRQVGAGEEDGDADERVLARELPDQLLADGAAEHRQPRGERASPPRRATGASRSRDLLDREARARADADDVLVEDVGDVAVARRRARRRRRRSGSARWPPPSARARRPRRAPRRGRGRARPRPRAAPARGRPRRRRRGSARACSTDGQLGRARDDERPVASRPTSRSSLRMPSTAPGLTGSAASALTSAPAGRGRGRARRSPGARRSRAGSRPSTSRRR